MLRHVGKSDIDRVPGNTEELLLTSGGIQSCGSVGWTAVKEQSSWTLFSNTQAKEEVRRQTQQGKG